MRKEQASALQLCCNSICLLLLSHLAATRGYSRFFCAPFCFRSTTNTKPNDILWLIFDKEMEMVALLFKWVLFIIVFFVLRKKGLLFLFQNCLNVAIMWNLKLILLYYLSHIPSILVLSQFWWSVPVLSMVYRWRTPAVVSSETPIHPVEILLYLSVSPLSRRCLMRSAHYWTQNFLWGWCQVQ